ncbi:MAG: helix-turn-helix domain-containing protein [Victivallaceae bacterium]|nr:helix-turn-helix domain-containing protein [Victivallaceae bacterium]
MTTETFPASLVQSSALTRAARLPQQDESEVNRALAPTLPVDRLNRQTRRAFSALTVAPSAERETAEVEAGEESAGAAPEIGGESAETVEEIGPQVSEAGPVSPVARRREEIVIAANKWMHEGGTLTEAAETLGVSLASLSRFRSAYNAGGIAALEPQYQNCGRKPLASLLDLPEEALAEVRRLVLAIDPNTGHRITVSLALRMFANSDACPDSLREIILKPRSSKHKLTPTLKREARITPEVKLMHRGPATFKNKAFTQRRELTYVNARGETVPLKPGDCYEFDDMTFNTGFYIPWQDAADPCALKFGVRAFRAQLLAGIDLATGRFIGFGIVARYNDSYRAKDILWTFLNVFNSTGLPRVALHLERGAWDANIINALGSVVAVKHATGPKSKFIEKQFDTLQKVCAVRGVNLGRKRGEFEQANDDWSAIRKGTKHPATCGYWKLADLVEATAAAMNFIGADPMEGEIYQGVPDEKWAAELSVNPLSKPSRAQAVYLQPETGSATIRAGHIRVGVDSHGAKFWFHSPTFAQLGAGYRVTYGFNPSDPEAGCYIFNAEEGPRARLGHAPGALICVADFVAGVPMFALSDNGDRESSERRQRFTEQVRLMYREIVPFGRGKAARVDERRDGRGVVRRLESGTVNANLSREVAPSTNPRLPGEVSKSNTATSRESFTATPRNSRRALLNK